MDSYPTRWNTIFCNFITCLGASAGLCHVTSYFFAPKVTATIELSKIYDMTINAYLDGDQSNIGFDLEADFTELFHWNMNQLFVYVTASFETDKNKRNEITIWDQVVQDVDQAKISLQNVTNEYPIRDQYRSLRGRNVRLILNYRTMPITGLMHTHEAARSVFHSPNNYFRQEKKKDKKKSRRDEDY